MPNGLVTTGTLFQHKDIHKATWVSTNRRVENHVDHLLISRQLKSSVLDTRVQRWANVNSNHDLIRTKTQQVFQHEKVQAQVQHGQTEGQRMYCKALKRRLGENRVEEREEAEELWGHRGRHTCMWSQWRRSLGSTTARANSGSASKRGNYR